MPLVLAYRPNPSGVPIEVEGIVPTAVQGKSLEEVSAMETFQGNVACRLGDFFDVSGDTADSEIIWEGDLQGVHWIGAKMDGGSMTVRGSAGRHVGSEMRSGSITVEGDTGDWLGGEMHGGTIHVHGRTGHLAGAAYRGSRRGMTGGEILVQGDAGNEVGHTMRRGLLVIGGNVGDLIGFNMLAGTIIVCGESGIRHGAGMRRGSIVFLGPAPPLLPSFRRACRYTPPMMSLIMRQLEPAGFPLEHTAWTAPLDLYHGDLIEGGRGEILLR